MRELICSDFKTLISLLSTFLDLEMRQFIAFAHYAYISKMSIGGNVLKCTIRHVRRNCIVFIYCNI